VYRFAALNRAVARLVELSLMAAAGIAAGSTRRLTDLGLSDVR
jgi:hypothetical protein